MRARYLRKTQVRRGICHRSLTCLSGLLVLSFVFAASRVVGADGSQSRFDHIDFVRLSASCGIVSDRDQNKSNQRFLTLGAHFSPAEPFCDPAAVEKHLRQFLYSGLLKPDSGQERSREHIVRNYLTSAPMGGHRELWISVHVWINETSGTNQSAPIHLCSYEVEQSIRGSNVSSLWMRSDPWTVVCGNKSEVAAAAFAFAEPLLLDTIAQLRRAK